MKANAAVYTLGAKGDKQMRILCTAGQAARWNAGRATCRELDGMVCLNPVLVGLQTGEHVLSLLETVQHLKRQLGSNVVWDMYMSHKLNKISQE